MPAIIVANTFYTPIPMPGTPLQQILEQGEGDTGTSYRRYWNLSHYRLRITVSEFQISVFSKRFDS